MVHPAVFREFGFDPDEVSGIAFGLGTTRMASQLTGILPRGLYEQDLRDLRVTEKKNILQYEISGPRIKREQVMHLSRQIAAFLRAGLPILDAVHSIGKPVILVMMTGSAVDMSPMASRAAAILQAWYPGQFGGLAVAETLLGRNNPAGRLPVTFYHGDGDLPPFEDYAMDGRTYRFIEKDPAYPFGFGLSYGRYVYSDLTVEKANLPAGEAMRFTVKVKNSGKLAGSEVAQVYLKDLEASTRVPHWQLVEFNRVALEAGEEKTLTFTLPARRLCVITDDGRTVLEPGAFRLYVGGSQPDGRSVELMGQAPLTAEFTVTGSALEMEY